MNQRRHSLAALLCLLLSVSALAAGSLPLRELSAERYQQYVTFLASDQLKGRGNGTPELERAAEYIANQFRTNGLQPAGDNGTYFQKFDLTIGAEFTSKNALQIDGVSKQKDKDFVTMPVSSSGTYEGPIVFAGYGITSDSLQWDDYAGIDVQGKAVLVFRHDPEELNPAGRFAKEKSAPTTFINKARNARQHGAKAILFITDPNNHPNEPDVLGKATADLEFRDLSIISMHVTREAVMPLFRMSGRDLAEVQKTIDQEQKPRSFEFTNSRVRVVTDVRPIRKTVRNVLASVQGSDVNLRNEWVVIGGHYDHLGLGDRNSLSQADIGKIHHGADDNASGTSGVLELARLAARNPKAFKRSLLFMTFAGEELGLFGSSHFVNNPSVPLTSIAAMINMDMIGRLSNRPLTVLGVGTSPEFPGWITEANKEATLNLAFANGGHEGSDHLSFDGKHIPTLFFFSGLHSDYHRPTDTADKINSAGAVQVLSLVAGTVELIANAPTKPVYTEVKEDRPQTSGGGGGGAYSTYFGSVPDFRDDLSGVLFADVHADSPAGKAGLKAGDLLVEFAGEPVKNLYDFTDALGSKKPGDVVAVVVKRNGELIKVNVTLEARR